MQELEKWKIQKNINESVIEEVMRVDKYWQLEEKVGGSKTVDKDYVIDSQVNYKKIEKILAQHEESPKHNKY